VNGQDNIGVARFGVCFNLRVGAGHGEVNSALTDLEMEAAVAVGLYGLIWLSIAGIGYVLPA
jgi:hypothetical protein